MSLQKYFVVIEHFLPAGNWYEALQVTEFIGLVHIIFSENALLRAVMPLDSSSLIPNLIASYLSPNPRTNYTIMGT
jgi:hypothetical protein